MPSSSISIFRLFFSADDDRKLLLERYRIENEAAVSDVSTETYYNSCCCFMDHEMFYLYI